MVIGMIFILVNIILEDKSLFRKWMEILKLVCMLEVDLFCYNRFWFLLLLRVGLNCLYCWWF